MRHVVAILAATSLLVGCGLPQSGARLGTQSSQKVAAKDVWLDKDSDIDTVMFKLLNRFGGEEIDPLNPRLFLAPKGSLHITKAASAAIQVGEEETLSAFLVGHLIASGKMEIDDCDPANPDKSGYWLTLAQDSSDDEEGVSFENLIKQRDYYAGMANGSWDNMNKVLKLDNKLIEAAYADAKAGNGCDKLKTMRDYYSNLKTPPNDGKTVGYHRSQLFIITSYILNVAAKDFDLLTELRDWLAKECPGGMFKDSAERAEKVQEVDRAINTLLGTDAVKNAALRQQMQGARR